jgi:hypothetical protein
MRKPLLLILLSVSVTASAANWRTYPLPSGGAVLLDVPAAWKEEIRQKDPKFAATIVLRPNQGKGFEVLFTPIPMRKPATMADVEASLIKGGAKHLTTAKQESIVLEKLEGEQATGRYYRLTEKDPQPDEYPNVIGGGLVVGPLIAGFTVLFHDGGDAAEALRVLQSARFLSGQVGVYRGTFENLRLNVVLAAAAGFKTNPLVVKDSSYKVELDDFLLEAEAEDRDTIRIRVDGKDLNKAGELLAALTKGFPRVR